MTSPLAVYAEMLERPHERSVARFADGSVQDALVRRWTSVADAVDERALDGLDGPVLDIGCGPGRHLTALTRRGIFALGVDLSPAAVGLALRAGGRAIVGSVFDEVPGSGCWGSALLLDGNIGIGGSPERLLRRARELLVPGGRILIELAPPARPSGQTRIRLETSVATSEWFDWAEVSAADADRLLAAAGLLAAARWNERGRWFVVGQS